MIAEACIGGHASIPDIVRENPPLLSGDEAVAFAALDAGVSFASAYPGTPATDIQEALQRIAADKIKIVWSINEKVAYESALAVGIAGKRALVSMKHVGMNVAADVFVSSCAGGTNGGLVLAVGDDPACHNSQGKQDSRHYRALSETILLEPSDSQEAYSMTREAFRLSERFSLPVILRLTSRTAYGCTPVRRELAEVSRIKFAWPKDSRRFLLIPSNCRELYPRLREKQNEIETAIVSLRFTSNCESHEQIAERLGLICTGIGAAFAQELRPPGAGLLKICGEPFPDSPIAEFIASHDRIIVLEEGDPVLERRVRGLAGQVTRVQGRLSGELTAVGELDPEQVRALIEGEPMQIDVSMHEVAPRFPEICKPCGYNKVFGALKEIRDIATPSDLGCNTLGGLPPYSVMDGNWAMGSSIGVACGLAAMGHPRVIAIIGDSTFYHAGIPALIEAVHQNYTLTVLLLDNGAAAMTGGQSVPHRPISPHQNAVNLADLIKSIGVKKCTEFDPHKLGVHGIKNLIEQSLAEYGVKVLLYRSQCGLFTPGYQTDAPYAMKASTPKE